ncbi:MAG: PaaI family thioesterase [Gammaproteobacteria bacterium]|nr:PaaI family thioesterase [Gammaproteobacteria bacterium]
MAEPKNPRFEQAVRESFAAQQLMGTLGARLARVAAGEVEIRLPFRADLTQQHGFLHAGVVAAALDSACGYAAFSLMPAGAGVLSIEFKINLVAPARGEELIARGQVVRAGRTVTVCQADAFMRSGGEETLIATMLATMMTISGRPDVKG